MLKSALLTDCIFPLTDKNGLLFVSDTLFTCTFMAGELSVIDCLLYFENNREQFPLLQQRKKFDYIPYNIALSM